MDKIKINLDREKLSSEYIHSKQDFKKITDQVQVGNSIAKSTWFYGVVGLASITLIISLTLLNSSPADEKKSTLKSEHNTIHTSIEKVAAPSTATFSITGKSASTKTAEKKKVERTKHQESITTKSVQPENVKVDVVSEQKSPMYQPMEKKVTTEQNIMPHIGGHYAGDIALSKLCEKGLEINETVEIQSFKLYYSTLKGDKTIQVKSNYFPDEVCQEIKAFGLDQMVFITDIIGKDELGVKHQYTSLNLTTYID